MGLRGVLIIALSLALVLSAVPKLAYAATYTDTIAGRELFATSTLGVFAGSAAGSLPGSWYAAVQHTPLDPNATITGGSFSLATVLDGSAATVSGTFSGGSVTLVSGTAGCVNQTYSVNGTLANVGVGGGSGTGSFIATLVHYRALFFRYCITYKATVAGSVALDF